MTIERMHHNEKRPSPPRRSWAWRAGRLVATRRWPKHLAGGVAAWVALGVTAAWMDPQGLGLIDRFAGTGDWFAAGVGLTFAALVTNTRYRRRGTLAALGVGAASLAAVAALTLLVNWTLVAQAIVALILLAGLMYRLEATRGIWPRARRSYHYDDDGYNSYGWGWYWRW